MQVDLQAALPRSVDELRNALTSDTGPILLCGGGTKLAFSNLADGQMSAISTAAMNRVLHYEPADLTVAVEAGMTVAELDRVLGDQNQMLPIDCPHPETSTLGGMFASGLGGPRRLKYGSLRDWVLGLEVMGPDGVLTKSGGMVVKNVTGYDLPRLHFGAHGAFGVVTRLNLKVLPREGATRSIVATFETAAEAHSAAISVLVSQMEPVSIIISNAAGWQLSVACAGPQSSIEPLVESIIHIVRATASPTDVAVSDGKQPALGSYLQAVESTNSRALARLSIPASQQLAAIEQYAALVGTLVCADPGSGLVYLSGLPSLEWREAVRRTAQDAVFLALPDDLKTGIDVFGSQSPESLGLLKKLKSEFDPDRRLNRERFINGI